ncbi:MAG: glycosyl hydrolase family 18 protein [Actinomycetes bacterium]
MLLRIPRLTRTFGVGLALTVAGSTLALMAPDVAQGAAQTPAPRPIVTGWMPYWMPSTSTSSVVDHAQLFDEASPFLLQTTSTTGITFQGSASTLASMVTSLHNAGVKVVPTLTTSLDADQFANLLKDRSRRNAHARAIANLAQRFGVDGIDLDYETINFGSNAARDVVRAKYPLLLARLDHLLARNGMVSSVTVPPRRANSDPNWWVFDYPALGAVTDRFRIMTYDYSWSGGAPGPMAPKSWVDTVLAYAVTQVAPSKISFGLPAYGRDWFVRAVSGRCPSSAKASLSRTTTGMQDFAASIGVTPTWNAAGTSRTFTYRTRYHSGGSSCVAKRAVWFDDAHSVASKLPLVEKYGLRGVAIWALGNESAPTWTKINDYAVAHAVKTAKLHVSAPTSVTYGQAADVQGTVTVAGAVAAGAKVTLWRRPPGGTWTEVGAQASDGTGAVSFAVVPRHHVDFRLTTPATWAHTRARSAAASTRVDFAVKVATTNARIAVGSKSYVLTGAVTPAVAGTVVQRQRLVDGAWVPRGTQTVDSLGQFSFTVRTRTAGVRTLRVVALPGALDAGHSSRIVLTVA